MKKWKDKILDIPFEEDIFSKETIILNREKEPTILWRGKRIFKGVFGKGGMEKISQPDLLVIRIFGILYSIVFLTLLFDYQWSAISFMIGILIFFTLMFFFNDLIIYIKNSHYDYTITDSKVIIETVNKNFIEEILFERIRGISITKLDTINDIGTINILHRGDITYHLKSIENPKKVKSILEIAIKLESKKYL